MAQVLVELQMNHDVADTVRTSRDSTCDDTKGVRLSVADDTGSDQSSPILNAKASSKGEMPGGPGAFQGSSSTILLLRGLSGKCRKENTEHDIDMFKTSCNQLCSL